MQNWYFSFRTQDMKTCFKKDITFQMRPLLQFKTNADFLIVFETQLQKVLGPAWRLRHFSFDNGEAIITCISLMTPEGISIKNKIQLLSYCDLRSICRKKVSNIHYKLFNYKNTQKVFLIANETHTAMQFAIKMIKYKKILRNKLQNIS